MFCVCGGPAPPGSATLNPAEVLMTSTPEDETTRGTRPLLARLAGIFGMRSVPVEVREAEPGQPIVREGPSAAGQVVESPSENAEARPLLAEYSAIVGDVSDTSHGEVALAGGQDISHVRHVNVAVRDFVLARDCSVRLSNVVTNNDVFREWSVAAAIGDIDRFREDLAHVRGLGRRSLSELFQLLPLGEGPTSVPARADSGSAFDLPVEIDPTVRSVPIGVALRFFGCSYRLGRAIEDAGLNDVAIAEVVADPSRFATKLREARGIGKTTIDEASALLARFLEAAARKDAAIVAMLGTTQLAALPDEILTGANAAAVSVETKPALEEAPPRELLAALVASLPEREHFVLVERYGLDGSAASTLQEVADQKHVTRERIRQIEARALRRLRLPVHQPLMADFLRTEQAPIWNALSRGLDLVTEADLRERRREVDPWQMLVIEVVHGGLAAWLEANATATGAGWLRRGVDPASVAKAERLLAKFAAEFSLPAPVDAVVCATDLALHAIEAGVEQSIGLSTFEGYLCSGRAGKQVRRTIRLHHLASRRSTSRLFDIATLAATYRADYPEDTVAPRMFQMQMEDAPHLFCRLFDSFWFALPIGTEQCDAVVAMPFERETPLLPSFEPCSIGARLSEELANGPRRLVELRAARDSFDGQAAESSIGAVLLSNPCFRRVAPGIFDLCRAGSPYDANGVLGEIFLDDRQCRAYCLARYGGAPVDWYPAWGLNFELWLARWARLRAEPALFRSLLHVVDPARWQAPNEEIDYWRRTKERESAWQIGTPRRFALGRRFIEPDQFLPAIAQLAFFGWTSWVAVNRTTDVRSDFHDAADVLALLIKAGLVTSPPDWQQPHLATECARAVFASACREMHERGRLDWGGAFSPGSGLISRARPALSTRVGSIVSNSRQRSSRGNPVRRGLRVPLPGSRSSRLIRH